MRYKLIFVLLTVYWMAGFSCAGFDSRYSDINKLRYVNEDYSRSDLLFIMGIESNGILDCVWKISAEELAKEKKQTIVEVLDGICMPELSRLCDFFLHNAYEGRYKDPMFFESFEILTVNDDTFGNSRAIVRNDWILVMTYSTVDKKFNEKIFMTPSKRIILSSTGYESVKT